jgi:hypothetical protein
MDNDIAYFVGITNQTEDVARTVLEMCGGDAEQAVMLWFNDEELQRSLTNPTQAASASASSGRAPPPIPHTSRPRAPVGREDASGVIHIDSDDDNDMDLDDDFDDADEAANVAARAQEEEDAAMAKRLQEELYGGGSAGGPSAAEDDSVRAPIARVTETLVAPGGAGPWADDDQEEMNAALLEQLRRRRAAPRKRPLQKPFPYHSRPTLLTLCL